MIAIIDVAKECHCDPVTLRKWIKRYHIEVQKTKAKNGKLAQAITDADASKFSEYWAQIMALPDNMILVPDAAKRNNVDKSTIRNWAIKNNITLRWLRNSRGSNTHAITLADYERFVKEYNEIECKSIQEIIDEYHTDRKTINNWAVRNGCKFVKIQSDKKSRTKIGLSKKDAHKLEDYLRQFKSKGFFYMIQPIPEYNLNRIKLGFSTRLHKRLKEHRGVCPNAALVKKWRCNRIDEYKVMEAVTQDCVRLYTEGTQENSRATEVFECSDYTVVLDRLNKFFDKYSRHETSNTIYQI